MRYSDEVAKRMGEELKGKVIEECVRETDGDQEYWVMTFEGGGEICFRFMAELAN